MAALHRPRGVSEPAPHTPCHTHPGKTLSVGLQIPQGLAPPPPSQAGSVLLSRPEGEK